MTHFFHVGIDERPSTDYLMSVNEVSNLNNDGFMLKQMKEESEGEEGRERGRRRRERKRSRKEVRGEMHKSYLSWTKLQGCILTCCLASSIPA